MLDPENPENDVAFTDVVDPHQARMGRREALQFASLVVNKDTDSAESLVEAARTIESYLDGE